MGFFAKTENSGHLVRQTLSEIAPSLGCELQIHPHPLTDFGGPRTLIRVFLIAFIQKYAGQLVLRENDSLTIIDAPFPIAFVEIVFKHYLARRHRNTLRQPETDNITFLPKLLCRPIYSIALP